VAENVTRECVQGFDVRARLAVAGQAEEGLADVPWFDARVAADPADTVSENPFDELDSFGEVVAARSLCLGKNLSRVVLEPPPSTPKNRVTAGCSLPRLRP
jgi:hypothetical protein